MLRSCFALLLSMIGLVGCVSSPSNQLFVGDANHLCEQTLGHFYQEVERSRDYALPYHFDSRFPHLAFDRISASLTHSLDDAPSRIEWLSYVSKLGQQQLDTVLSLSSKIASEQRNTLTQCQQVLTKSSADNATFWESIQNQAPTPPTAYQHWKRVLGAYPIASVVAQSRIEQEQTHIQEKFGRTLAYPFRYSESRAALPPEQIEKLLSQARQSSALGWPMFSDEQTQQLLNHYSPVVTIETQSPDDLPGTLQLDQNGNPMVNTQQPRIYRSISYTRFDGKILPQLNYVLWFAARTATSAFDPYAGELDAINLRLTLDTRGAPLILDSIHQCGCFHMVYALSPTLRFTASDQERPIEAYLPSPTNNDRLTVSLTSGDHMINHVSFTGNMPAIADASSMVQNDIALSISSLDSLMTLKTPTGVIKSPFNRHGIIEESARGERWFLWPFGVRSPGAMRQQGKHAIAFIGERHFDDAFIFDALLKRTESKEK